MARYIDWRNTQSPAVLEERVNRLETRVTALTDALRALTHALESLPGARQGDAQVARAARQAYDLLLAAGPPAGQRSTPPR